MTTRALDCSYGQRLKGVDDDDLFLKGQAHADEHLPNASDTVGA